MEREITIKALLGVSNTSQSNTDNKMIALKVFCALLALFALCSDASPLDPRTEYKRQAPRGLNSATSVS